MPSSRAIRRLDILSVLVVLGFAALGLLAGLELWEQARLHRGLLNTAAALEATGRAIGSLAGLPLVGDDIQAQSNSVTQAAAQVRDGARALRDGVRVLAVVVGLAIALLAVIPVAVLYLPLRLARRRELRELRRMLSGPAEPMLIEHLAHAAIRRMPYRELRRISPHPWRDLEGGNHDYLVAAELRRLGLPPHLGRSTGAPASSLAQRPDSPGVEH